MKKMIEVIWLVLAVICIFYGLMVKSVGSGTRFFAVWPAAGIVCLLLAAAVHFEVWKKLPVVLKTVVIVIVCAGVVSFVIAEGCVIRHFNDKGVENADYLIVLGAQIRENGPSSVLKFRLDRAVEYLEENEQTRCIVSGGQGYNEPYSEAEGMAEYLISKGISQERILLEKNSSSTRDNMRYCIELMKADEIRPYSQVNNICIITNDFHMFRALQTAEDAGMKGISGLSAGSARIFLPNNLLREYMGEMNYLLGSIV